MRIRGISLVRTAVAAVFGFMSLVHGPVMTFAKANPITVNHVMNTGGPHPGSQSHHHHHTGPADNQTPASAPVCYAFACFIALGALAQSAPPVSVTPMGPLLPAPAAVLLAGLIEPPVPPPR